MFLLRPRILVTRYGRVREYEWTVSERFLRGKTLATIAVIEYVAQVGVSFRRAGNEGAEERGRGKIRPDTAGKQKREWRET